MTHPYKGAPTYTKWRQAIGETPTGEVDPVVGFPFRLRPQDRVATAGSCFAANIGRALRARGFDFVIAEPPHPFVANVAEACGHTQFSARYGNVYTTRQMLQLVRRALGLFEPADRAWTGPNERYFDPYRPTIQPGGYVSRVELEEDRARHLACVRRLLGGFDYLVFTLGLTEAWVSACDGAVYPLCPGVAAGRFDPERHLFVNFSVDEIVADAEAFFALIRSVNPRARMILTVSPVAIAATAEDRHVLAANTYSKAVLRVAAETVARRHPDRVAYFPSYEIVAGIHSRGAYVLDDLRSVSEAGIAKVMEAFVRHATEHPAGGAGAPATRAAPAPPAQESRRAALLADLANLVKAECDEEMLGA